MSSDGPWECWLSAAKPLGWLDGANTPREALLHLSPEHQNRYFFLLSHLLADQQIQEVSPMPGAVAARYILPGGNLQEVLMLSVVTISANTFKQ